MDLQVTQENLSKALQSVVRIASSRSTLPILSNILLKTVENRLQLSATNLDIATTHFIGAKIKKEGSITIPAKLISDFVSSLPLGNIDIKQTDNKITIKSPQYNSVINGVLADDFPVMPEIKNGDKWNIDSLTMKKALQQVVFATSNDESRPVLTGVFVHSSNGKLFLAATDSYRLAEKSIDGIKQDVKMLIPHTAAQELLRLLGEEEGILEIVHDDQQVLFRINDVELVARLIDGNYPDYKKLIPNKFTNTATLKKRDLNNITKVSSLFARESAGSVTLETNTENSQLTIKAVASQLGENTASADAKVNGEGIITLNSRYIIDALSACDQEDVKVSFNGKLEPSVISQPSDPSYVHIIMPLKS